MRKFVVPVKLKRGDYNESGRFTCMSNQIKYIRFILMIGLFFSLPIFAQNLYFDNWQVKDGLPQNSINCILQTRDGYLWLGTSGGLVRFDGISFKIFNTNNTKELKSNRIVRLFETQSGAIIVFAYETGLVVYQNNKFTDYSDGLDFLLYCFKSQEKIYESGKIVWQGLPLFAEDKKQRIFIGVGGRGVAVLDPVSYKKIPAFDYLDDQNFKLHCKDASELYFTNHDQLYCLKDESLEKLSSSYLIGNYSDEKDNCTWNIDDGKLNKFRQGALIESYILPESEAINRYKINMQRVRNKFYISNIKGEKTIIVDLKKREAQLFKNEFSISKGNLNDIYGDREGNVWYSTSTGGLFKIKFQRFEYIDKDERILSRNFYPVVKDHRGHILLGSQIDNYSEIDSEGNYIPIPEQLRMEMGDFYCYDLETFKGAIYIPVSFMNVLYKIEKEKLVKIPYPEVTGGSGIIYRTKKNNLLVGVYNKILKLEDERLIESTANKTTKFETIVNFFEDSKGLLWVIGDKSIYVLNKNEEVIRKISSPLGKPHFFRGTHEDAQGRIYIGSYGNGLTVIDGKRVIYIDMNNGLYENVISTISEDKKGNIWFTGNLGLTRISKLELTEILQGKRQKLNAVLYNEETDVMRTSEFNGGNQHSKCWLGDDVYLFPTINGCVRVDFSDFEVNNIIPPVHIEHVLFGDSTYSYKPRLELPYKEQRLDIKFTALSLVSPKNVNFKYKLEGYDKDWIDGGHNRSTFYNKIQPGEYIFKVIASNNEGIWNNVGAQLKLKIIPPFYMTFWFKALLSIIALIVASTSILEIFRRIRKREQEKSAMMDILPDLVLKLDKQGHYLDIYGNPSVLVKPFHELKGKSIRDFLSVELSDYLMKFIEQAFLVKTMQQFEYELEISDGKVHHFEGRVIAKDKEEVLLIIRDITENKEAQERIIENEKSLSKAIEKEKKLLKRITEQQKQQLEAIINTEERERRRIAIDLHDGIGQLLSSVKINLSVAGEKIMNENIEDSKSFLNKSKESIDQITNEIRNISYNLLPPSLEQFGLSSAIEEELKKMDTDANQKFSFYSNLVHHKIDSKAEVILFRSFQEIINNAIKHSKSTEITVQLIEYEDKVILMIEDNGSGFNFTEAYQKKDSSGLKNLFSRVALIHGKMKVDSNTHSGTSITIEVPLK